MTWQPIETAPKDGRKVWCRRVYDGEVVSEQWAVFGAMAADAPMRFPLDGGLGAAIPADNDFADTPAWCTEDMRFHVPTPTEWRPPSC